MTPQEAVKAMKFYKGKLYNGIFNQYISAFDVAISAIEKQIPKEPVISSNDKEVPKTHKLGRLLQYHCPTCNNRVLVRYETDTPERGYAVSIHYQNCSRCGQRIDFGDLYRKIPGDEELELED